MTDDTTDDSDEMIDERTEVGSVGLADADAVLEVLELACPGTAMLLLLFFPTVPPTAPPTTAPIMTSAMTAMMSMPRVVRYQGDLRLS